MRFSLPIAMLCAVTLLLASCQKKGQESDKNTNTKVTAKKVPTKPAMVPKPVMKAPSKKPVVNKPKPAPLDEAKIVAQTPLADVPLDEILKSLSRLGDDMWFGLYVMGKKMGWFHYNWKLVEKGGKKYIANNQKMHIELINLQGKKSMTITINYLYEAWGKGLLKSQTVSQSTPMERSTHALVKVKEGEYTFKVTRLLASTPGNPVVKTSTIKKDVGRLGNSELAVLHIISKGEAAWGKQRAWKIRKFLHTHGIVSHEVQRIKSSRSVAISGVNTKVYDAQVITAIPRSRFEALLDTNGKILEGKIGMFKVKREERRVAINIKVKDDLGVMAMIPAPIHNLTPTTKRLTLTMSGDYPQGVHYFNTHRYKVAFGAKREVTLTLTLDDLKGLTLNKVPKDILVYKKPGPGIESDHPVITKLAATIVGAEKDPSKQARLIVKYLANRQNMKKNMWYDYDSAVNVAKARRGDCTEHSLLFTALARSLGIPARRVGGVGLVTINTPKGHKRAFGYHMWVQIWLGRWIDVDPTWGQYPADVSHIMMGDQLDSQWIMAIGTLKIISHKIEK